MYLSFFKVIKRSILLALASLLPGLVLGVSVALNRINAVFPDKDDFFSNQDYFQTVSLLRPIIDIYRGLLGLIPDDLEQKLLYGLVGFLFLIVFWIHVAVLNSSFSWRRFSWRRFWHENYIFTAVRIAEYFLLSLIGIVLLGKYLLYYSFPLAVIIPNLIFWHLWHENGIWGDFNIFDYRRSKESSPWRFYKNISFSILLSISLRSLVFSLILLFIPVIAEDILDKPQLLVNYLVSYRTWFTVFNHAYFDVFAFSLSIFTLPILNILANKANNKPIFYGKIAVPLILTVAFGLMYLDYQVLFINRFDINKSAFKLAQFQTNQDVDRQLIIFKDSGPEMRPFKAEVNMRSIDLERKVSDLPGDPRLVVQKTPCTEANRKTAQEIYSKASVKNLESALYEAYLTYSSGKGGFEIVYGCSLFDFDMETILNDKVLAGMKSTDRFGSGKQHLDELKALFSQGVISGTVSYEGDMKNIKVALLAEENKANFSGRGIKSLKVGNYSFLDGFSLMAGKELSETGKFAFQNVIAGDYYLAIMLMNGEKVEVALSKPIQKMTLSEEQNIFDVGSIIIQKSKIKNPWPVRPWPFGPKGRQNEIENTNPKS